MEVNEIINPYFSFPVVGVVILALLVYAFGFKSPVQPPSFDFDGERKSTSGSKKRKVTKKPLTNGHVPVVTTATNATAKTVVANVESKTAKPSSTKVKVNSTNTNSVSATQKVDVDSSKGASSRNTVSTGKKSDKGKKEKNNAKIVVSNEEALKVEKKPAEKQKDEGEWVQLLSRKEKKNRKREELVEEAISVVTKGESANKKPLNPISPTNSKENSPSKKKQTVAKNEVKKNAINKEKVMKEKLDDNFVKNAEVKPEVKPAKKLDENVIPVKADTKDNADVPIQNGFSTPKKKKGKAPGAAIENGNADVAKEPAQIKKDPVKEVKKEPASKVQPVVALKKETPVPSSPTVATSPPLVEVAEPESKFFFNG
ncbi:hypothetical protein CHUAL_004815 [Chamberlinius hualienensis]